MRVLARWLVAGTASVLAAVVASLPAAPALASSAAAPARSGAPADVYAAGADLVNASTGAGLWSRHLNVRRPMGSITKVMTALLVIRAGDLNREIRVTSAAVRYVSQDDASSAGLIAGDVLTARQLLEAMLVPSGCDAAYLLATAYGPGRGAFVRKMNAMARALGMTSTHFSGFDGMPYPTEYSTLSTPADLVRLGEQAMRYPVFRSIVAQRSYYLAGTARHHSYDWLTTNELLASYRGALGIKTGATLAAGNCLLFEARRHGRTLIGVLLHVDPTALSSAPATYAGRMLNWGFDRLAGTSPAS